MSDVSEGKRVRWLRAPNGPFGTVVTVEGRIAVVEWDRPNGRGPIARFRHALTMLEPLDEGERDG